MIRGLYTSGLGMKVQGKVSDVTANNLANVNTVGFKRDTAIIRDFPEMLLYRMGDTSKKDNPSHLPPRVGYLGTGALLEDTVPIMREAGILQETGNPLDMAITGHGWFVVQGPGGEELFTKQGNFKLNPEGMLVTNDGFPVLGEQGEIYLDGTSIPQVNGAGEIFVDGNLIDTLRIVNFVDQDGNNSDQDIEKVGYTLLRQPNQAAIVPAAGVELKQGFLEGSNVNSVREMVTMIQVARAYEANQKAVQAHDQALEKAINEVGRS